MSKQITVAWLYPKHMNIYGDRGNLLALKRRIQWHGYIPEIVEYNVGDTFPKNADIIIGGGGQDSGQFAIHQDLIKIGPKLIELADKGVPMLVVCGLYQLFGKSFTTNSGRVLKGIGLLPVTTVAKDERLIGNIITSSPDFGDIIGYENHSGQTFLDDSAKPLGIVQLGAGNNLQDGHEGVRLKNVIGTYLHGSLLPKNPRITDFLIKQAAINRYGSFTPGTINDDTSELARISASKRPR